MGNHQNLGNKGEEIARKYLNDKGFSILEQNWHFHHKEIDLIAHKDGVIHIVEVKSRSGNYLELPRWAVNKQKQRDLVAAANGYIVEKNLDMEVSFDIIEVIKHKEQFYVRFIPDAFYPLI
jgi:putative endonuclease